jgi:predicted amidohydrolase
MRIALAQIDVALGQTDVNLERAMAAIDEAVAGGADLIVFPELATSGYSLGQVADSVAMPIDDPRLATLAERAEGAGVLIGFPEEGPRSIHIYNSAVYLHSRDAAAGAPPRGPSSRVLHGHRKLFLPTYDIFEERKHFSPGQQMRAYDTPEGRMATLICNDAWQPQLAFLAIQDGAQILLVPTNSAQSRFPDFYDSATYWRDITAFYARMYQCYVVFVNRVGDEGSLRFWGGSHVVDPWGQVVAEAPMFEPALVLVDVDLALIRKRRREVPLVKEARLGLVQREAGRLVEEGGDL